MNFKQKFITSTAMALTLISGYGRRSYAACSSTGYPNYLCSGTLSSGQFIYAYGATVRTAPGFNINTNDTAIFISGDGGDLSFTDQNASTIRSTGGIGLLMYTTSPGSITINTNGTIISDNAEAIYTNNTGGAVSITADGNVLGYTYGISARNNGTNLTINTGVGSDITGLNYGIFASNDGSGELSITANGSVLSDINGINARNNGTNLTVTTGADSDINANSTAIFGDNRGSGILSITTGGIVTSNNGYGILAANRGTDLNILVNQGSIVTGNTVGIRADQKGTGVLNIAVNGEVHSDFYGIYAYNQGSGLNISTSANTSVTGEVGIIGRSNTGATNVTLKGYVRGISDAVYINSSGTDLLINTGPDSQITSMNSNGIRAINNGSGITSITVYGGLIGEDRGLFVDNNTGDGLTIITGENSFINGNQRDGILASNYNTGQLSIDINGSVSGHHYGVLARNFYDGGALNISTGENSFVRGTLESGISARNYGYYGISVDAQGVVEGGINGIIADNRQYGTDISITTGQNSVVSGMSEMGISAQNSGTGILSLSINGDVTGFTRAIDARNSGTDLTITTSQASHIMGANSDGIMAQNSGSGILSITANGYVAGRGNGILASNSGTDLSITTGAESTVQGTNSHGISARNIGTGILSITANGETRGSSYNYGIQAITYGNGLYITTGDDSLTDGFAGIRALSYGYGSTSIDAGGEIHGVGNGVTVRNSGLNLNITTRSDSKITGDTYNGIYARNNGVGETYIAINGEVSGANNGIDVTNYGTDLLISASAESVITGGNGSAIMAINRGTGDIAMSLYGTIVSDYNGVYTVNSASGTDLNIAVGADSTITAAGRYGIYANNKGSGTSEISIDGTVTATNYGLRARSYGDSINITTGLNSSISGTHGYGIYALNTSVNGTMDIALNGEVTGYYSGLRATSYGASMNIAVGTDSSVIGENKDGMYVRQEGYSSLSITNHGRISGYTGITLQNEGGISTGIVTDGIIEGTGGTAILFANGSQSQATPIEIAGGRIIGNVTDNYMNLGYSPVTVTGDFTSEGSFLVSDFNVASGGDFTLNYGNGIDSFNTIDVDGTFTANGGNVTNNLSVNSGGILKANEDFNIGGSFTNNGSTSIATGKNMVVDSMSAGTGDLSFGFNTVNDHALLTVSNGAADLTGQNIFVNVVGVTGLATGEQALIISGAAPIIGGPGSTAVNVADNSVLWNFRMVDGTGVGAPTSANDLFLIAGQAAPINNLTSTTNNERTADVLMTLQSTTDPELALIVGNMNGASTTAAFNEVLEAAQPVADASERMMQTDFLRRTQDMIGARLNELRSLSMPEAEVRFGMKEDETSLPAASGLQVWGYGFGTPPEQGDHGLNDLAGRQWLAGSAGYTHQSRRQGIDGFDAVSGGAAFGIDTGNTYTDRVLGLAVGYGHAEVDSNNANRAENEIDSLQLLAYASKNFSNNYYGDLKASYAQASNDTTRYDVGGVPGLTANGDFTSKQAGLQANVGKRILHKDYLITPEFGVNWLHYTSDGYTETGAGGANLTVDTKSADSIEIGGSVRIVKEIKRDSGAIILPELRAGYYYDVIGDPIQKTVSFAGGGSSFLIESPNPSQHRINLGAGVTVKGTGDWDYSLNYSLDMQSQAQNHNLVAKASWKF